MRVEKQDDQKEYGGGQFTLLQLHTLRYGWKILVLVAIFSKYQEVWDIHMYLCLSTLGGSGKTTSSSEP